MAHDIFVDTSGFYALLVKRDDRHQAAVAVLREAQENRCGFVTTDYVLDETATLLKARGHHHLLADFFETLTTSKTCRIVWTDSTSFEAVQSFFLKHIGQAWSFTDCLSFRAMKELRLREALTKDAHFAEAGFVPLLVD